MRTLRTCLSLVVCVLPVISITSCTTTTSRQHGYTETTIDYGARMPKKITTKEKVVVVDPSLHAWGAYNSQGELLRAGVATTGAPYCPDINSACRTSVGSYRIFSLGSADCKSSKFPVPRGGAPMPYCMFFNGGQGLHGSGPRDVVPANVSHGCVRMHISDAEWLRFNFATIGTKVVVKPY